MVNMVNRKSMINGAFAYKDSQQISRMCSSSKHCDGMLCKKRIVGQTNKQTVLQTNIRQTEVKKHISCFGADAKYTIVFKSIFFLVRGGGACFLVFCCLHCVL